MPYARRYRRRVYRRPTYRRTFARKYPRRSLGYGSRRVRRRFYKCRSNGGTWRNCKRRAFWKPYQMVRDPQDPFLIRKEPRAGWEPYFVQYTKWRKVGESGTRQ